MESSFVDTSKYQLDPGSWQETIHDVWIGILVGGAHNVYAVKKVCWDFVFNPLAKAMGMRIKEQQRHAGTPELKVIGVGFGRTGTVSLTPWKRAFIGCNAKRGLYRRFDRMGCGEGDPVYSDKKRNLWRRFFSCRERSKIVTWLKLTYSTPNIRMRQSVMYV